jgi:hypothetical protein
MGTDAIKKALAAAEIDPKTLFDGISETDIDARVERLNSKLTDALSKLGGEKIKFSRLRANISTELTNVFTGLGEQVVSKTGVKDL